jgi:hypothetical protein
MDIESCYRTKDIEIEYPVKISQIRSGEKKQR